MTQHEDSVPVAAPPSRDLAALAMKAQVGASLFGDEAAPVKVGRYEILEAIGVGGMGVVYSAWDESLGRRVALKVLPGEQVGSARERARLAREAQALAKLSHPNVVHVYEVGEHEHGVFVAMELVDGVSLQKWQQQATRSTAELVEVYLQAGRGLAAAHRAGLVHRDFKPANVLLGKDGRVRVVDFGLAHGPGLSAATTSGTGRKLASPPQSPVTRTGALAGTPAYMAPEQLAGTDADARADQFSFCVALYEALVGCRPFAVNALRQASERSVPAPSRGTRRLPLLLRRALRRGLAIEPSRRFPDMEALLRAIEARGAWRRRAWAVAGPVALGLGVAWLGSRANTQDPAPVAACEPPVEGPAAQWGARKARIEQAIERTRKPFASETWAAVDRTLGSYAQQWSEAHIRACRDADETRSRSVARCLDRSAVRFDAVLTELERVDAQSIPNVDGVLATLAPIEHCFDLDGGSETKTFPELSPERLALVERARAIAAAQRDRDADEVLTELLAEGSEPIDDLLRAELLVLHGEVLTRREHFERAWDALARAQAVANDDEPEARAILAQVGLATHLEQTQSAEVLARQAAAFIERLGKPAALHADLLDAQARLRVERDPRAAVRLHREALDERARAAMNLDDRRVIHTKLLLATALDLDGRADEARVQYEEVLKICEQIFGPRHPRYAAVLFDLGLLAQNAGEIEEAHQLFEQTLEVEQAAFDPDSTMAARTEVVLAQVLFELGDQQRALALARHAWDVQRSKLPSGHSDRVAALRALASIEFRLEHHAESLALHRRLVEEAGTADTPDVLHNIAWLLCQEDECPAARPFVDQARQQIEVRLLGEHTQDDEVYRLYILHTAALVALAEGKLEDGRALLTTVIEQAPALEGTEELVREATTELAQARRRRR